MTQVRPIPDDATQRQILAAAPGDHVWVSANAGSGKTRVLIDRVARLLLDEVPPQNILCLTYTKAAASEMQNRLFDRLGGWAMLPDGRLSEELVKLGSGRDLSPARLASARRLFARAIEAPGGLRIQTIHAFCASLLRRFPLEAGVSPQFQEMDDRAGALMRAEIADELAETRPDLTGPVAARHNGEEFDRFLAGIGSNPAFAMPADEGRLARALGSEPGTTALDLIAELRTPEVGATLRRLRDLCAGGSPADFKAAAALSALPADRPLDLSGFWVLTGIMLFGKGAKSPFGAKIGTFPTKGTQAKDPDLMAEVEDIMAVVEDLRPRVLAQLAHADSLALHLYGHAFHSLYSARKLREARVDFDDLIARALALLTDRAVADWVLFKLDGGIDHILVDEAQDTSPDQWRVVRRLAEDFAAGEGARPEVRRTLFVVGDKKQSIYSFQGADPAEFDRMRAHFAWAFDAAQDRLIDVPLEHSFRSSPAILGTVDRVFTGPEAEGVEERINHIAFRGDMPGRVDLWPVVEKEDAPTPPAWNEPLDRVAPTDPKLRLAQEIAARIRGMIDARVIVPRKRLDTGEWTASPVTEGDILILVRGRKSGLFDHLIRACKAEGLNIAGADRLRVGGELAVKDLAALLRFLALPEDDLALAAALRSPLFGWTEQELFTLAHRRPERTYLWTALRAAAADHPRTMAMLDDLRRQADFLRPYDLIDRILNRWRGRHRLLSRLGVEAEDGIDALLSQALAYEQNEVPSLTGFVGWMQADDLEIKRQADGAEGKLRVMTVHGSKGLEAPIVILPDCQQRRDQEKDEIIALDGQPIWKPRADDMPPRLAEEIAARREDRAREARRLLYVGMTRAESWLIVGAAGELGKEPGDSWHGMIAAGMEQGTAEELDTPFGPGLRHETGAWDAMIPAAEDHAAEAAPLPLPDYGPAEAVADTGRPVSPSDLGGSKAIPGETDEAFDGEAARARGTALHLLLEHLPSAPAADRGEIARQLVSALPAEDPVADRESLIADALALVEAEALAPIFAEGALAEVTLSAPLRGRLFLGAIDRLLVTETRVLAIDYKSNRLVPDTPEAVPDGILRQMGAYAAMLEQVYPGREIETAILWTAEARLMPLPRDLVISAFTSAPLP